jgi:vesicle-fusing ATPase
VPLPDRPGRIEILDIHLAPLVKEGLLQNDVYAEDWVDRMENFSGADIEAFVGRAKNLALLRNCETEGTKLRVKKLRQEELAKITKHDMELALNEFIHQRSKHDNIIELYARSFEEKAEQSMRQLRDQAVEDALKARIGHPVIFKICGEGHDATALACAIAESTGISHCKYVGTDALLGLTSQNMANSLDRTYHECLMARKAVLIMDNLADLPDRSVMLKLKSLLNRPLPTDSTLIFVVVGSTGNVRPDHQISLEGDEDIRGLIDNLSYK